MSNGEVVAPEYEALDRDPWGVAGARGQVVRIPEEDELFLDLDTEEQYAQFGVQVAMLNRLLAQAAPEAPAFFVLAEERPSRRGLPHRHVVVRCARDLQSPLERVLLQAVLGSDPKREALDWVRIVTGSHTPSVFFETPGE